MATAIADRLTPAGGASGGRVQRVEAPREALPASLRIRKAGLGRAGTSRRFAPHVASRLRPEQIAAGGWRPALLAFPPPGASPVPGGLSPVVFPVSSPP